VASKNGLELIIDPETTSRFVGEYWQSKPLHIPRNNPHYFAKVFTLDALDALLARGDLWHPNIRIFHGDRQVPFGEFSERWAYRDEVHDRIIDRDKLLKQYEAGATINLLGLERTYATVMELSKLLEVEAGFPVRTDAFLSPPNSANIPPHFDMTDVLVTQISGSKEWVLWSPNRLSPLNSDTSNRMYARDHTRVARDKTLARYVLYPGDTLYVPRGVLHETITTETMSLHLAFGFSVHRWYDVIEAVARQALVELADEEQARQALPVDFYVSPERTYHEPEALLDNVAASLRRGLDKGLEVIDRRFISSRTAGRPGQLAGPLSAPRDGEHSAPRGQRGIEAAIPDER
jgi:ribosomal protein L16 Arg81 hydroxylase